MQLSHRFREAILVLLFCFAIGAVQAQTFVSSGNSVNSNIWYNGTGKVGIGTTFSRTLPSDVNDYKLFVTKGIRTEKVKVDLATAGWGDYVFAPQYVLRPLIEVENFIRQYGHLPDVPSEATLQKEGLNLGEMLKIQMVKIEELTLYILAQ
ncbi:MAG: hypothetical protein OHK0053_34370 [Microscillaceae bacterium]